MWKRLLVVRDLSVRERRFSIEIWKWNELVEPVTMGAMASDRQIQATVAFSHVQKMNISDARASEEDKNTARAKSGRNMDKQYI